MKNYLLKFFAGIFCICLSHSLFAQTAIKTGSNNETTDEINNSAADSSFGFYIKYADNKEPQKPINTEANSLIVSRTQTHVPVSEDLKKERIYVQPNPVKNFAFIKIEAAWQYKFTIEITSIGGKLLQQKTGKTNKGNNIINLDLQAYAKGIYMVTVIDDKGKRKTIKIVKE